MSRAAATAEVVDKARLPREHLTIAAAGYEASVSTAGADLRTLTYEGRELVVPYGADEPRPAMRGAVLVPWPNRTADGRYEFGGAVHQLPINEPARGHASHGLVADLRFDVRHRASDGVTLGVVLEPQPGYPWRLDVQVTFTVSESGLGHLVEVRNESASPAPVGIGVHPYVLAGPSHARALEAWNLRIPASEVMLVTSDRLLPDGIVDVGTHEAGRFDYRELRQIDTDELNHAWTSLRRGDDALARVWVTDAHGEGVEIALDESYRWVQAYTSDEVDDDCPRAGIAIEPMTCPADALNSQRDLLVVEPGLTVSAMFSLRHVSLG